MNADIEPYDGSGHPLPSADRLRAILQAGIRAPSAENRHWLRFEVGAEPLRLGGERRSGPRRQEHRKQRRCGDARRLKDGHRRRRFLDDDMRVGAG